MSSASVRTRPPTHTFSTMSSASVLVPVSPSLIKVHLEYVANANLRFAVHEVLALAVR